MFGKKKPDNKKIDVAKHETKISSATPEARELLKNILEMMQQLKITLPQQIGSATQMTAITAEGNAIRYHYVHASAKPDKSTKTTLRNTLYTYLKQDENVKNTLKSGVQMEYEYTFAQDKDTRVLISFSKDDFNL